MLSGTAAREMKSVPSHFVTEQLPNLVLSIILGFHDAWAFVCSLYGIGEQMSEAFMVPGIVFL